MRAGIPARVIAPLEGIFQSFPIVRKRHYCSKATFDLPGRIELDSPYEGENDWGETPYTRLNWWQNCAWLEKPSSNTTALFEYPLLINSRALSHFNRVAHFRGVV